MVQSSPIDPAGFASLRTTMLLQLSKKKTFVLVKANDGIFENVLNFQGKRKRLRVPKPVTSGPFEQLDWFKPGKAVQTGRGVRSKFLAVFGGS